MKTDDIKGKLKKFSRIATFILAVGFLMLGTLVIVYYSRGYRIDRNLGVVEKTGVLNIESDPFRATIFINGKEVGKTPKTISSLKEGRYDIQITKDGYMNWNSTVEIVSEKSTPIFPHLFLLEPEVEDVFKIDNDIVSVESTQYSNYIFVTTRKDVTLEQTIQDIDPSDPSTKSDEVEGTTTPEVPTDSEENIAVPLNADSENSGKDHTYAYKIWRYDTNPSFWGASLNPRLIYEADLVGDNAIDLKPSYNGEYILLTTSIPATVEPFLQGSGPIEYDFSNITLTSQLLQTNTNNDNPSVLDISGFLNDGYTISWSKDDEYLIMESADQIVSVDILSDTKYLLKKTNEDFVWTTDGDGNFYYLESVAKTDQTPSHMKIHSATLTGSTQEILVDRIYYSSDASYLIPQQDLLARDEEYVFTNSPTNPQFAGRITRFEVENSIDSILIETEFALYLYDIDTDRYTVVSSIPSTYHQLAPNLKSFIYSTAETLNVYVFDKETADHTSNLGATVILNNIENIDATKITWHNGSRILFYSDGTQIWSIDTHSENNFKLLNISRDFFLKDASGDYIFTVVTDSLPYHLERAKVN